MGNIVFGLRTSTEANHRIYRGKERVNHVVAFILICSHGMAASSYEKGDIGGLRNFDPSFLKHRAVSTLTT